MRTLIYTCIGLVVLMVILGFVWSIEKVSASLAPSKAMMRRQKLQSMPTPDLPEGLVVFSRSYSTVVKDPPLSSESSIAIEDIRIDDIEGFVHKNYTEDILEEKMLGIVVESDPNISSATVLTTSVEAAKRGYIAGRNDDFFGGYVKYYRADVAYNYRLGGGKYTAYLMCCSDGDYREPLEDPPLSWDIEVVKVSAGDIKPFYASSYDDKPAGTLMSLEMEPSIPAISISNGVVVDEEGKILGMVFVPYAIYNDAFFLPISD